MLRLQELLAQQGYLPLRWKPTGTRGRANGGRAGPGGGRPPRGSFGWRYGEHARPSCRRLWSQGKPNTIIRGAVMMFEHENGLARGRHRRADGLARAARGPARREALAAPYSYVFVRQKVAGAADALVGRQACSPRRATPASRRGRRKPGTFPVFGQGTGRHDERHQPRRRSHYHDPGIRWISYFNGGDAIHAFPRASFGTPQSLGCVELPLAAAASGVAAHADRDARHDRAQRLSARWRPHRAAMASCAAEVTACSWSPTGARASSAAARGARRRLPARAAPQPSQGLVGLPVRDRLDRDEPVAQPPPPRRAAAVDGRLGVS